MPRKLAEFLLVLDGLQSLCRQSCPLQMRKSFHVPLQCLTSFPYLIAFSRTANTMLIRHGATGTTTLSVTLDFNNNASKLSPFVKHLYDVKR